MIKTLIITSCCSNKLLSDSEALTAEDVYRFNEGIDLTTLPTKQAHMRARGHFAKAYDMYVGDFYNGKSPDHLYFFKHGYERLKEYLSNNINFGNVVDLKIVSAGYGLLNEDDEIYPYDITYQGSRFEEIKRLNSRFRKEGDWGDFLNTRRQLDEITMNYDLILFFLSDEYLKAVHIPEKPLIIKQGARVLFFNKDKVGNYPTVLTSQRAIDIFNDEYKEECGETKAARTTIRGRIAYLIFDRIIKSNCYNDPFKIVYDMILPAHSFDAKDLRKPSLMNAISDSKPGYYKWWAKKEELKLILKELGSNFEEVKEDIERKGDYYCIYIGISTKESIRNRIYWHVEQKHTSSEVKNGILSTLRQSISSLVAHDQYNKVETNNFIDKLKVEVFELDQLPISSKEANMIIDDIEKIEINSYLRVLNIKDNNHPKAMIIKKNLKSLRIESKKNK